MVDDEYMLDAQNEGVAQVHTFENLSETKKQELLNVREKKQNL